MTCVGCRMAFAHLIPLSGAWVNSAARVQRRTARSQLPKRTFSRAVAAREPEIQDDMQDLLRQLHELRAKRDALAEKAASPSQSVTPADSVGTSNEAIESVSELNVGRHGESSRFIPLSTVGGDEYFPRVVPVLDLASGATPKDFADCPAFTAGVQAAGHLSVATIPTGYSGQVMGIPLSGKMTELSDPIALAVPASSLSDSIPVDEGSPVYLIVERGKPEEFDPYKFYVWDYQGELRIGWLAKEGVARCLGQIYCGLFQEPAERRKAKSCWQEEIDTYYS